MNEALSTNFDEKLAAGLASALQTVLDSPLCPFYREKYSGRPVEADSYGNLCRLPFLERAELTALDWRERVYVPADEVELFGVTSGTTDSARPLLTPRARPLPADFFGQIPPAEVATLGVKRIMVLHPPMNPLHKIGTMLALPGLKTLSGDIKNIPASAAIAGELGVGAVLSTPSALAKLADAYDALGYPRESVKWISIGGEPVSKARFDFLRTRFPEAYMETRFASTDLSNTRYYHCRHLLGEPALFHPAPGSHIFEVVSPEGVTLPPGSEGELVHTDVRPGLPFPFFRYRTGDAAELLPSRCACGAEFTLRLSGKLGLDSLRFAGIGLRTDHVETGLMKFTDLVEPDFRLHLSELTVSGKTLPAFELKLIARDKRLFGPARAGLEDRLRGPVADSIYIAPSTSIGDLLRRGEAAEFRVTLCDSFPADGGKPRRLLLDI